MISSFRRVQNVVCFLLGDSAASDLYMPTFRNTLSVPSSKAGVKYIYSTNIRTKYFKLAAHSPFFPLQNAVYFIMLPFLVPVLFTF